MNSELVMRGYAIFQILIGIALVYLSVLALLLEFKMWSSIRHIKATIHRICKLGGNFDKEKFIKTATGEHPLLARNFVFHTILKIGLLLCSSYILYAGAKIWSLL